VHQDVKRRAEWDRLNVDVLPGILIQEKEVDRDESCVEEREAVEVV